MTSAAARSMSFAQAYAQAYAQANMNSTVVITRPALASYDQVTRAYVHPSSAAIYTGIAGVTLASGPISMSLGDEPTYYSSITAYLPHDGPSVEPRVDDVVTVTACPDAHLVGRSFRVTDAPSGGRLSASTTLSAVGIAPSRQWI